MNNKHKLSEIMGRLLKMLFKSFPILMPIIIVTVLISSVISSIHAIFLQRVLKVVTDFLARGLTDWELAKLQISSPLKILITLYSLSIILITIRTQVMAYVGQTFLHNIRLTLYKHMQYLPISYFDKAKHGDIMSHYTNDVDSIRMLITEGLPVIVQSGIMVITVFFIMLYFSVWMTMIALLGIVLMVVVSNKIGGGSAGYFMKVQKNMGNLEGFLQEMMTGQKVIKVFNHEEEAIRKFESLNKELRISSEKANGYANILGPIILNIGNILYVSVAVISGLFLLSGLPNFSISGLAFDISILIPFLNMTKQFTGNINELAQQINSVVMALAGADRVFTMLEEEKEVDQGKIRLVNVKIDMDGKIKEAEERSESWAWKKINEDGSSTLIPMRGDMRMSNVNFAYEEGKDILHDISVYAEPGDQVAFVGETGAGKTTITNLMNRFYEVDRGKILYDGINIRDIKKSDLRKSLGLVLQNTNLFTGTVMENIRYGRLDASDEECIKAAKLVGADSFIERLPMAYETPLTSNGSNLSQGQRQLISIARAAVADTPALVLDEATSSIDTHTEQMVLDGMRKLMEGRTVFVIAHRLSTIEDSDVIMVMDHGRIIERGDHESLINEKGIYYRLYTGAFEMS